MNWQYNLLCKFLSVFFNLMPKLFLAWMSWFSRQCSASVPPIDTFRDYILYFLFIFCHWAHHIRLWVCASLITLLAFALVLNVIFHLWLHEANLVLLLFVHEYLFLCKLWLHRFLFESFLNNCIHFVSLCEFYYLIFKKSIFLRFSCLVINWKMHLTSLRGPASVQLQPSLSGKVKCYLESHPSSYVSWYLSVQLS